MRTFDDVSSDLYCSIAFSSAVFSVSSGTRWRFRTLWPLFGSTTSWLSWTINTAASPWRTTSCCSTTSARSRGTCRSDRRLHSLCNVQLQFIILVLDSKWSVIVSPGSVPGRSSPHGHDHLQKPEGRAEDPGQCEECRGKTCSSVHLFTEAFFFDNKNNTIH